jgi:hypothetical protein
MKNSEWLLVGLGVLFLMSRANAANQGYTYGQNPYAYNTGSVASGMPGALDLNAWNVFNATPNYYLGTVPTQSPMDAYVTANNMAFVGKQVPVPVGSF